MKKGAVAAIVLAGVLALGGGSIYAAEQIAKSSAISSDNAKNFAFADAGVLPENAKIEDIDFEFEHGKFVYEIEFTAGGIKYEYVVDSTTGQILGKETEIIRTAARNETDPAPESPSETAQPDTEKNEQAASENTENMENTQNTDKTKETKKSDAPKQSASKNSSKSSDSKTSIGLSKAKSIALKDAGLSGKKVTYTEAKQERDDGKLIYDLEFRYGDKKYEYEIDAYTGKILDKDVETKKSASSAPASTPKKQTISIAEAKSIALKKVGLTEKQVTFTKAKLDQKEGEYEIEFYVKGKNEYEIEIDAYTGKVLEVDIDDWDD